MCINVKSLCCDSSEMDTILYVNCISIKNKSSLGWKVREKEVWALVLVSVSNPSRVPLSLCDFRQVT